MVQAYQCPVCRKNRSRFRLIYRLSQQIQKDPETGDLLFAADILEPPVRGGKPELEVECADCGYIGAEPVFIRSARQARASRRSG